MIITYNQLNTFEKNAFKKFEDEMVGHIKQFFRNHSAMMQEEGIRKTIVYGYGKACGYNFFSQRNVCLYLNNMIILGSNFDTDPMYPWAGAILSAENNPDSKDRIDRLSDKAIEVMTLIAGSAHANLNRAFLNLYYKAGEIFNRLINSNLSVAFKEMNTIFPEKMGVIGKTNFWNMVEEGTKKANQYGIRSGNFQLVYLLFMYLAGSGFDTDPQFSFAEEILKDDIMEESKKVDLLFRRGMEHLKHFLVKT